MKRKYPFNDKKKKGGDQRKRAKKKKGKRIASKKTIIQQKIWTTLLTLLLNNRSRLFFLFSKWKDDWGYNGEAFDILEIMSDIFMTGPLFIQVKENMIVFLETKDKFFYILTSMLICNCKKKKKCIGCIHCEKCLFDHFIKIHQKIKRTYDNVIETKKVYIKYPLMTLRKTLIQQYCVFEMNQCVLVFFNEHENGIFKKKKKKKKKNKKKKNNEEEEEEKKSEKKAIKKKMSQKSLLYLEKIFETFVKKLRILEKKYHVSFNALIHCMKTYVSIKKIINH